MSEWQPIETAPKDGREILGIFVPKGPYDADYSVVQWSGRSWVGKCDGCLSIDTIDSHSTYYHEPFLTHWMPLPTPPEVLE